MPFSLGASWSRQTGTLPRCPEEEAENHTSQGSNILGVGVSVPPAPLDEGHCHLTAIPNTPSKDAWTSSRGDWRAGCWPAHGNDQ